MLKIVVIIIVVAIAAVLGYASTQSDVLRVERSTTIKAPPEKIFGVLNDFHNWQSWSPYEKLDPEMKRTLSGADNGKGAVYAWDGAGKAGAGRMEIIESAPASKVTIKLDFSRPFEGHSTAEYTLVPQGDTTKLTWAMVGPAPFITKLMGIFVNLDTMIGKDFEDGLANLKALAEK